MKKKSSILIILILLLTNVFTSFADITEFGYSPNRHRVVESENYMPFQYGWRPVWYEGKIEHDVGKSYTQPLIIDGKEFGKNNPVIITMAGNYLYGYESLPREELKKGGIVKNDRLLFKVAVPGGFGEPSASHVTYFNKKIFYGTKDGYVVVADIKKRRGVKRKIKIGSKIVSAPLVSQWKGYEIAVIGSDDGKAYVVTNLHKKSPSVYSYEVGGVLTSTPAPINSEGQIQGFAIGSDGANGKVVAFDFGELLEEKDGMLKKKLNYKYKWMAEKGLNGVPASFSVDEKYLYFSDKSGKLYKLDKYTGDKKWINTDFAGGFINRSPALYKDKVYFPIVDKGDGRGTVAVIDKVTGELIGRHDFGARLSTAPVVWPSANIVLVGQEGGWLGGFYIDNLKRALEIKLFDAPESTGERSKAEGFCSEISVSNGLLIAAGSDKKIPEGGYLITYYLPETAPDLYVKSLNLGLNSNEKAKVGLNYSAVFKAGFLGEKESVADIVVKQDGVEIKRFEDEKFTQGEEKIFSFDWMIDGSKSKSSFEVEINPDRALYEKDYTNNKLYGEVKAEINTNLKIKIIDAPESAVKGQVVEIKALVELEGEDNIATDVVLKVDQIEVRRLRDLAIGDQREVNLSFEMPDKDIKVYAEVNTDKNKPIAESSFDDNTTQELEITLEKEYKNPNPQISVSISAPKTAEPKIENYMYKDWEFTVTVTWKDLYKWKRVKVRDAYTDEDGVYHPAKYKWKKKPIYKTYTLNTKAYGQGVTMYYPNTGEQIIEKFNEDYEAKSKTVSFSGTQTYKFSFPGSWFVVDTKSYYGFGPGGYNVKLTAVLDNGAKDTKLVYFKGIPPIETGVELVE